ncbi:hypothetical protein PPERSA_00928 [Pseudocohnilembus persalinus]|uniref:RING-type domain-containing protein n=1 Tax=Pseudocohnilembus persalinus TaxID=266149 RepID=A0A0V0QEU7_PSEPJ|nr:hypothetical protein PPERSA_00928 [Pseudocohnilembus persalinus]|eukprot:KRX00701.1 hypothetical protein PPERSA_00928 [Pseudocohnilembus persalinus]
MYKDEDFPENNNQLCGICYTKQQQMNICSDCLTKFCSNCVSGWKLKSNQCPFRCHTNNWNIVSLNGSSKITPQSAQSSKCELPFEEDSLGKQIPEISPIRFQENQMSIDQKTSSKQLMLSLNKKKPSLNYIKQKSMYQSQSVSNESVNNINLELHNVNEKFNYALVNIRGEYRQ